jgi:heme exporter protein A
MGQEGFEPATFSGTGLACRRGGAAVFAGLTFTLSGGDALVLRGANGSGKSTLLRLMAGLSQAADGTLAWNGTDVREDPDAHGSRLRFVGHLDGVKAALSVFENLAFWASVRGGATDSAITAALARFGMARLAHLPARVLSAGQRHRLALARLLVKPAPLWLLDEPTNALDDEATGVLASVIADHRARGGLVVLATHGAAPMADAADLNLGRFTASLPHWSDAA